MDISNDVDSPPRRRKFSELLSLLGQSNVNAGVEPLGRAGTVVALTDIAEYARDRIGRSWKRSGLSAADNISSSLQAAAQSQLTEHSQQSSMKSGPQTASDAASVSNHVGGNSIVSPDDGRALNEICGRASWSKTLIKEAQTWEGRDVGSVGSGAGLKSEKLLTEAPVRRLEDRARAVPLKADAAGNVTESTLGRLASTLNYRASSQTGLDTRRHLESNHQPVAKHPIWKMSGEEAGYNSASDRFEPLTLQGSCATSWSAGAATDEGTIYRMERMLRQYVEKSKGEVVSVDENIRRIRPPMPKTRMDG